MTEGVRVPSASESRESSAPGTEADTPRRNRYDLRTGSFEAIE